MEQLVRPDPRWPTRSPPSSSDSFCPTGRPPRSSRWAWAGREFSAAGEHYSADKIIFRPTPVQQPRIPVWCVALWPAPKSTDRAARWDGMIPAVRGRELTPDDVRDIRAWAPNDRFEIVVEGTTEGP
jgi:hypothetical protein